MTFLIESDAGLAKANAHRGHLSKSAGSDTGEAFARSLAQQNNAPETGEMPLSSQKPNTPTISRAVSPSDFLQNDDETPGMETSTEAEDISSIAEVQSKDLPAPLAGAQHEDGADFSTSDTAEQPVQDDNTPPVGMVTAPVEMPRTAAVADTSADSVSPLTDAHLLAGTKTASDPQSDQPPARSEALPDQAMSDTRTDISAITNETQTRKAPLPRMDMADTPEEREPPPVPAIVTAGNPDSVQTISESERETNAPIDEPAQSIKELAPKTNLPAISASGPAEAGKNAADLHTSHSADLVTQTTAAPFGALPSSQPLQQQIQSQLQMTPTHALVTASPAETVKIITDTIASPDDAPDRITVQLDPPELGRVSIDFKFDAHGLQHITVTGESPEALKQLRLMHFELTQALERSGLSSQNMTFQQQQSGQQHAQASMPDHLLKEIAQMSDAIPLAATPSSASPLRPARTANGGLDIRL
jgi:hypothetical protein